MFLDGSLSDTAVEHLHGLEVPNKDGINRKESQRERDRDRQNQFGGGLSKKSNSTSQISVTGKNFSSYMLTSNNIV